MSDKTLLTLVETAAGGQVLGHASLAGQLARHIELRNDIHAEFVPLPPVTGRAARLTESIRGLARFDIDLQAARWHGVYAVRARHRLQQELMHSDPEVVLAISHVVALGITKSAFPPDRLAVSVDVTIWPWREMGIWRPVGRMTRLSLLASEWAERRLFGRAALVHSWSGWTSEGIRRLAPQANIAEIPPGVDLEVFHARPRSPRPRPRVLFVGGRFAAKGGFDLLDAVSDLLRTGDLELDVVTREPLEPRTGLRIHALAPGDPELVRLYQEADLVCLPTYGDAVPFSVLEAMACGTPVVATPVGAIPEMVAGGGAGHLVPIGDVKALRSRITELLDDGEGRLQTGEAARARVEQHYDSRQRLAELLERLTAVAANATRGSRRSPS